ncbi:MAG: T9SS type A sorting domain-containing protein [Bacteroidia bacterium]
MKKITLLFIFISVLTLSNKAQIINCSNFCILSIGNLDTIGQNRLDVTISNGVFYNDSNIVNYPTIVVVNSLNDTVANKNDYFYLPVQSPDSTVTQTIPTTLDSIPFGFTGTVYLRDRVYNTTCSFPYPMTCTAGIHELTATPVMSIYPNPATTNITISLGNLKNKEALFTMYDDTGKKVRSFNSSSPENIIDRGNLPGGIYFINVLVGDKQLTKKIILE